MSLNAGTSMLILNDKHEVVLFLRDNIPSIPYPGKWDILGGGVEEGETPEQCILRELGEEIELYLKPEDIRKFRVTNFDDRVEHTYWILRNLDLSITPLHEGQKLQWFSEKQISSMSDDDIAFQFRSLILDYFNSLPRLVGDDVFY